MVKAHSLLYAVYICLIVSILCGALLYFASLFNQLNLFYNTREDLYIQNQSAVNYALGSSLSESATAMDATSGIVSSFESRPYGLLDLLIVKSFVKGDTIASTHFVGRYANGDDCIHLANFSKALSFGGVVRLIGNKKLPSERIREEYLNNIAGKLTAVGSIQLSEMTLPKVNPRFNALFEGVPSKTISLRDVERTNDSVYYNSFLDETIAIALAQQVLDNVVIKGNFILHAKDSIRIGKNAVLEDVIIKAPRISFEQGFKGNVQAFSTESIHLEKDVELQYPSVLCVFNASMGKSHIEVGEECKVYGAIVLFGNEARKIEDNEIVLKGKTLLVGDVYCSGKLMVGGKIYGSVHTNRFFHKTDFGSYDNCIINAEIDVSKRPSYFVSIPFFEDNNAYYGIQKKVL